MVNKLDEEVVIAGLPSRSCHLVAEGISGHHIK